MNLDKDPIEYCTDRCGDRDVNLVIAVTDEFKQSAECQINFGDYINRCGLNCIEDPEIISQLKRIYAACVSLSVMCQIKVKFGISPDFDNQVCQELFEQLDENYGMDALNNSVFEFFKVDYQRCSLIQYSRFINEWASILYGVTEVGYEKYMNIIFSFPINASIILHDEVRRKYTSKDIYNDEENALFDNRFNYFADPYIDIENVRLKIFEIYDQVDTLCENLDGDNLIQQLELFEKQERLRLLFIVEYTAKLISGLLKEIDDFKADCNFFVWAIVVCKEWSNKYLDFRLTYHDKLKNICEEDGIEEEVWQKWYEDWRALRFLIEQKFQSIIQKRNYDISISQQIVAKLEIYRDAVDRFYCEERKGIYQKYAFQSGGDIQDKLETESELYKLNADFQRALQNIVFKCYDDDTRCEILLSLEDLLDIQIDEIIEIISDKNLDSISETILTDFSELRMVNYSSRLYDAKSYGEELARRDKQFNSLLFKMRKGLIEKEKG